MIGLTTNQRDVLEKIIAFSGYVTKESIAKYKGITPHGAYKLLNRLESMGYLKSLDYFTDQNKALIYQVKLKACKELGRGDAYMRKTHSQLAIHKYLIYSHFCFSLISEKDYDFNTILNNSRSRIEFLKARGLEKRIPRKYNYNKRTSSKDWIYQIEELILTQAPFALDNSFGIAYADKIWQSPLSQLSVLLDRYDSIILNYSFPVVVTIIAECKDRLEIYLDAYQKKFQSKYKNRLKFIGYSINCNYIS